MRMLNPVKSYVCELRQYSRADTSETLVWPGIQGANVLILTSVRLNVGLENGCSCLQGILTIVAPGYNRRTR